MTSLLELKEKLRGIYAKYEMYINPALKFLVALAVFSLINSSIGYMTRLDSFPLVLILSLLCSLLPVNAAIFIAGALIEMHMYALSLEVALVVFAVFIVAFVLFFRFAPTDGMNVLLTPLCLRFQIGPVMPVATGLLGRVYSVISILFGTFVFYFLEGIRKNASVLGDATAGDDPIEKISLTVRQLLGNQEMIIVMISFTLVTIVVNLIRRLSIEHAWTISIIIGLALNFLVQFTGFTFMSISGKLTGLLVGTAVSALIAVCIKFLFFNLDYSRTERVQFEDDEYYYYVKAVPKITVSGKAKQVKKFSAKDEWSDDDVEEFFDDLRTKNEL
ncbi:MAG: hypothetical protein ACK5ML_07645 [Lachnospiraceae bacterium]